MNAIELRNVWKRYSIPCERVSLLRQALPNLLGGGTRAKKIAALENINLNVKKGETVGIIGKNASGKTTLLKLLAGITYPSQGAIKVTGAITALLELGAGFHPDLTGRENVYLNGSFLGLTKRYINKYLDSIVLFAEIGDFIDMPMRVYSAGMYLRLGFAVAAHAQSDTMLIDEVLIVGDMTFQERCRRKIKELKDSGTTILFASHDLGLVEDLSDRVILLDKGIIYKEGTPSDVIRIYKEMEIGANQGIGSHPML